MSLNVSYKTVGLISYHGLVLLSFIGDQEEEGKEDQDDYEDSDEGMTTDKT